ncbi:D-alanyl-D-alanine carboxypeptidase/D-alanyl-D-alanine-endopeptidase [Croceitalea sp. MTPC9]|nr:D-alanyl-D-alanine carboxypeptidase/D-alanyl-D-alanine-endopeptidase [Croceitalea sp. MTPC6]GMN15309.1 D-alanyl-D-alanine carboxypeptidase/D-alanyl-D-alanine-endopeptidase [Croceitalea sp. MTPC9]
MLLKSINYIFQVVLNQWVSGKIISLVLIIILFASCSSARLKQIREGVENDRFKNQFTGFLVVDAKSKDTILAKNSTKYFIPASNVKIVTLYASLKLLPEKIPTLKYVESKDSLHIEGTGDPSWLHPYFMDSTALEFLSNTKAKIVLNLSNFHDEKFRPGWAWEDYQYYFSPELGPIPLYGNVVSFYEKDSLVVSPNLFSLNTRREKTKVLRDLTKNEFSVPENLTDTLEVPFITSKALTKKLIQKKINQKITLTQNRSKKSKKLLYGIPTDSILKRMLYKSDNFLAEQLMLSTSSMLSDTLSFKISKDFVLENYLSNLKQQPRWVDGSGLSRYNLFTPESLVAILQKLYDETDKKRLFHLLPAWDNNGTITKPNIKNELFIFAKSGSMGNTYNLSGYLKTKSGKLLLFSFMNNHFRRPTSQVRQDIYTALRQIHNTY